MNHQNKNNKYINHCSDINKNKNKIISKKQKEKFLNETIQDGYEFDEWIGTQEIIEY